MSDSTTICWCIFTLWVHLSSGKTIKTSNISPSMKDPKHGVKMGTVWADCDDAKTRLETDWAGSPLNYTCFRPKQPLEITNIKSIHECAQISPSYLPQHHCMDKPIAYNTSVPTFGDHRPLWPVFGEYRFVPVQRWLHNIEHGAVVMLYDPCAHPEMVSRLRGLVTSCIRKHVITPFNELPMERPLALVTWGCRLMMNFVRPQEVVAFIRKTALRGPEGNYTKEGQFSKRLMKIATPPKGSDYDDSNLCPGL